MLTTVLPSRRCALTQIFISLRLQLRRAQTVVIRFLLHVLPMRYDRMCVALHRRYRRDRQRQSQKQIPVWHAPVRPEYQIQEEGDGRGNADDIKR